MTGNPATAAFPREGALSAPGAAPSGRERLFLVHLEPFSSNHGQTLSIAETLRAEGWDAHIVCRASCRLAHAAGQRAIPAHLVSGEGGTGLGMAWKLLRIVRGAGGGKGRCLVHACDLAASRAASLAWRVNKKMRLVHTRRIPDMENNPKALRCYQVPPAYIIADSLAGEIGLRLSGVEPHRVRTIACGFDPATCAARMDRDDGRFVFAVMGDLLPGRGHTQLFGALSLLEGATDLTPWEARILGDGPHFASLLQEAETMNIARRTAFLRGVDTGAELCKCDALVLPASEGESYVPRILWGWAAHMPLVTVNRLDHAEILRDEENCLLVRPNDPADMAEKMGRLARDPALRRRLAEGGRAALAKFGVRAMVDAHTRLYREILA